MYFQVGGLSAEIVERFSGKVLGYFSPNAVVGLDLGIKVVWQSLLRACAQ